MGRNIGGPGAHHCSWSRCLRHVGDPEVTTAGTLGQPLRAWEQHLSLTGRSLLMLRKALGGVSSKEAEERMSFAEFPMRAGSSLSPQNPAHRPLHLLLRREVGGGPGTARTARPNIPLTASPQLALTSPACPDLGRKEE